MQKYPNLNEVLENETSAREYFDSLPDYVREHIQSRADGVNSFESLKDYAENLLRGDN